MFKQTVTKALGPLAAVGAIGGFIDDVLKPFANFALIFLVISLFSAALAGGLMYYYKNKDGVLDKREKMVTMFSFSLIFSLIWIIFVGIHSLTPKEGVLAANFDGIATLQKSILNIETDVADIKEDTKDIKETVTDIDEKIDSVNIKLTQVDRNGGVISDPQTPQDFYNNAEVYKIKGENENAITAFEQLFEFNLPYIDPHLEYADLRSLLGQSKELQEYYEDTAKEQKDSPTIQVMNAKVLEDREDRIAAFEALYEDYPDYAPLLFFLINEYTWTSNRNVSTLERQTQKKYIDAFDDLPSNKSLATYYINIDMLKEAMDLIKNERQLITDGGYGAMVEEQMNVNIYSLGENKYTVFFLVYDQPTYIWYRIDGKGDFIDTGEKEDTWGIPGDDRQPNNTVEETLSDGKHTIEMKYQDQNGNVSDVMSFEVEAKNAF